MDKISSILASNHRVKTVDMDDGHPIRPGAPNFGQNVGLTAGTREQMRNHLAEQRLAEQNDDSVTISGQAKESNRQALHAEYEKFAAGKEMERATGTGTKSFVEEMDEENGHAPSVAAEAKPKSPGFFDVVTKPVTAPQSSNRALNKYA